MAKTIEEIYLETKKAFSTNQLKFLPLEDKIKRPPKKNGGQKISAISRDTAGKHCPYCCCAVKVHERYCPNCKLPVPDKSYRIEDGDANHSLSIDLGNMVYNIENEIDEPPPVPIKTAQGNEIIIKPILTNRRFVGSSLPYTSDRRSGDCSLRKFTVIDFETANMYPDSVCQLAVAVVEDNEIRAAQSWYIRPPYNDFRNEEIHGITLKKVERLGTFAEIWDDVRPLIENKLIGAYNARFDIECLFAVLNTFGLKVPQFAYFDILQNIREQTREYKLSSYKLVKVAKHFGIEHNAHDALSDVIVAAEIQFKCDASSTKSFMYGDDSGLIHLFPGDTILSMVRRKMKGEFDNDEYPRLIELVDTAISNGADKAKCLKLQGEILEKYNAKGDALEKYLGAYELNTPIGVKGKIQKLRKELCIS